MVYMLTQYCAVDKIENELGVTCSAYGEGERCVKGFGGSGEPEGKSQLGRLRRRGEDNIKMDLQEVGCGDMDWFELAHDWDRWRALVNALMNLPVP